MMMFRSKLALFLLSFCALSLPVNATFTIGAVDSATMQLGAAGSSCIQGGSIYEATYAVPLPGKALMLAQAVIGSRDHVLQKGEELLVQDTAPEDVITAITDPSFDGEIFFGFPYYTLRQYGIIDLQGRAAGYTGADLEALYGSNLLKLFGTNQSHTTGQTGNFTYAAQGNAVSNDTVTVLESTFLDSMGCGLADRLMEAVEAVDTSGNGDMRCVNASYNDWVTESIPGAGAYIHVDNPDGTVLVHIDVVGDGTFNPVESLRKQYDEWRSTNPCGNETSSPPVESTSAANSSNALWGLLATSFIGAFLAFL